jgi:hypothetical protein
LSSVFLHISAPESIKYLMVSSINNHLNNYQLKEFMNTFGKIGLTLSLPFRLIDAKKI